MRADNPIKIPLKLRYEGGDANDNRLNFYDGAQSLFGIAKSLQTSTHFLINLEVIKRSTAISGASVFILPSKKGSFEQFVQIIIDNPEFIKSVATNIFSNYVGDYFKLLFQKSLGISKNDDEKVYSRFKKRLGTDAEPYFDELSSVMEGSLLESHRTIEKSGGTIDIIMGRNNILSRLDEQTLEYVRTRDENPNTEEVFGHVTRYNVISGNGRFYDKKENKVIPFEPSDNFKSSDESKILTWSIDKKENDQDADICLLVKRIESARRVTKRYILVSCRHILNR